MSQRKKKKKKLDFDYVFIELHFLAFVCGRSLGLEQHSVLRYSKRSIVDGVLRYQLVNKTTAPHRVAPSIQMHKTTGGRRFRSGLEAACNVVTNVEISWLE